ncbi:MAG: Fe-S protein assembly co-chaperone HscB [Gammaproteobacteria bacterium]|nr:Fe-S protein assembly co-chaperone HscB [Gammaproteobacteria bacterium]MYG96346.1 Fe-S protein assembly co-chaperone HscB [Gammaproteobacteria bacterium]
MLSIADNYFSQFELPVGYDIDLDRLNGQFRKLQTIVHPDRYAAAGDEQRLRAIKLSSYLNEAYETLKSPLRRAGYLLKLQGVDVEQVDQSDLDPELLFEQIALRESLTELPKDESALDRLDELNRTTGDRLARRQLEFAACLVGRSAAESPEGRDLAQAKKLFHELQFLTKLQAEIEKAEDAIV